MDSSKEKALFTVGSAVLLRNILLERGNWFFWFKESKKDLAFFLKFFLLKLILKLTGGKSVAAVSWIDFLFEDLSLKLY